MLQAPLLDNVTEVQDVLEKLKVRVDKLEGKVASANETSSPQSRQFQHQHSFRRTSQKCELTEESEAFLRKEAGFIFKGNVVDETNFPGCEEKFRMYCTHGRVPVTSPFDFDLCFLFQLPKYVDALDIEAERASISESKECAARLQKQAEDARKDEVKALRKFAHRLDREEHLWKKFQKHFRKQARKLTTGSLRQVSRRFGSDWGTTNLEDDSGVGSRSIALVGDSEDDDGVIHDKDLFEKRAKDLFMNEVMVPDGWNLDLSHMKLDSLDAVRACAIETLLQTFHAQDFAYYTWMFTSIDRDELFVCAMLHDDTAKEHAYKTRYKLPLSKTALEKGNLNINLELPEDGEEIACVPHYCWGAHEQPKKHCYNEPAAVCYDPRIPEDWFVRHHLEHSNDSFLSPLRKVDRIRLMHNQITDKIDLDSMKRNFLLIDWFPLHTAAIVHGDNNSSLHEWANLWNWYDFKHPVDDIRKYFGETIAVYFIFTELLAYWTAVLVGASLVLVASDIYYCIPLYRTGDIHWVGMLGGKVLDPYLRVAFAIFLIIWCKLFSVMVERSTTRWLCIWGQLPHQHDDVKPVVNPDFTKMASIRPSSMDSNRTERSVPWKKRIRGRFYSGCGTLLVLLCGTFLALAILQAQTHFRKLNIKYMSSLMSILLTAEIKIFNGIWPFLCLHFVNAECHPTLSSRSDAIARSTFFSEFINTFCTFYYAAFFMTVMEDPALQEYASAWEYLSYQLFITFILYVLFSVYDVVLPAVSSWILLKDEHKKLRDEKLLPKGFESVGFIEFQAKLSTYSPDDLSEDFMEQLLPLGFVLCFGVTLPIGTPIALLVFLLNARVDAWKLVTVFRRPYPYRHSHHQSNWVWTTVISSLLNIAAVTNIGLISFVMEPFRTYHIKVKFLMFCTGLAAYFAFSKLVDFTISDVSAAVKFAFKRHEYQRTSLNEWLYRARTKFVDMSRYGAKVVSLKPGHIKLDTFTSIPGVYKKKKPGNHEKEESYSDFLRQLLFKRGYFAKDSERLQTHWRELPCKVECRSDEVGDEESSDNLLELDESMKKFPSFH